MKFGHEYEKALASEGFPQHWLDTAIEYKSLKKCIKKVHKELVSLGLDARTVENLAGSLQASSIGDDRPSEKDNESALRPDAKSILDGFSPQLRVLIDSRTGEPLDATLAPDTRAGLQKLARNELVVAGRHAELGRAVSREGPNSPQQTEDDDISALGPASQDVDAKWIQVPLASAKAFFEMLEPKLGELEALNREEERKLEQEIMDLGDMVEDVTEPVREGFEATRRVSYRDLYFWREMFRLYLEKPIFYAETERNRGALTFKEARSRLEEYDEKLRSTGLLAKLKTPMAKAAAKQFLDLNVSILKIMHFQEMNAEAMRKILKKFDKQTHLEGSLFLRDLRERYPALLTNRQSAAGGFANSIARDLNAEISSKVLAIVPQLEDWSCPVCYAMAWRPVNLGCCRSVFCIRCIIKLQDEGMRRCPCCNQETVFGADGRNIDFETMDFLEKYFPLEVKRRQKENEKASLVREYGEEFVKPSCSAM